MAAVALITLLILLEYIAFMLLVGKARVQGNIEAPAVSVGYQEMHCALTWKSGSTSK